MENVINFFDIPATDFSRAVSFYKAILGLEITETEISGTQMGFFPSDGKNASGAIVQGADYKPSADGVLVYLNGGHDLQTVLDRVASNNGKVIVPKTHISPEVGYIGMFIDTEGNKMAVHSIN
ncbi:VOC family protein [Chitinophaga oryzae]|uniref:VOC family protein n=1 Tax=Chitinophaga oryzae TaxID=2725414 RepID=A0AAE6ZGF0_9BACT|nr:VOC family protein [Chitinophaga oryzae]QJB32166.1 VOC family protein [Chitinophaga oryzae]QJB38642.1 VOC family protein [Chitinophaga oryzae]